MRQLISPQADELDLISGGARVPQALAAFVDKAARIAALPPSPSTERRHMASVIEATQLFFEESRAVAGLAGEPTEPGIQPSGLKKRRRKFVFGSLFASLAGKLAAGGVAVAMAATGGLAANGKLPDPVQDKIASVAEKIGIDIPTATDEDKQESDSVDEVAEPSSDDGVSNGKRSNEDVHAAIDSTEPGPERGKAVLEAARLKPGEAEGEISTGSESKGVSADVHAAIDSTEPGPERGKAVSEAASQNRHNGDVDEDDEGEGDAEEEAGDAGLPEIGNGSSHSGGSNKNKP